MDFDEKRKKDNAAQRKKNEQAIREACKKIGEELSCDVQVFKGEYNQDQLHGKVVRLIPGDLRPMEISLVFKMRSRGSYHYLVTDQVDVEVGERYSQGGFHKRFPPRKAGIPVGPIVEEIKRHLKEKPLYIKRQDDARSAEQRFRAEIDQVHDRLGVPLAYPHDKRMRDIRTGPHLESFSEGSRMVKFANLYMPLEDAEKVLKLVMELEAARKQ